MFFVLSCNLFDHFNTVQQSGKRRMNIIQLLLITFNYIDFHIDEADGVIGIGRIVDRYALFENEV